MATPGPSNSSDTNGAAGTTRPPGGRHVLAEYSTYGDAQRLVDQLSDSGFPVRHVRIVGDGVRMVEQVTGRLTKGRAALAGAASGAWFGLLIGLLMTVLVGGRGVLLVLVGSAVIGALWGAVFGFAAHAATGGRRDFASFQALEAQRYLVEVDTDHADEARRLTASAASPQDQPTRSGPNPG